LKRLHIVEPGLVSAAGHSYELTKSLVHAWMSRSDAAPASIWLGRTFSNELQKEAWRHPRIELHRHFHHSYRKLQSLLLYRQQWVDDAVIVLPTARLLDMLLLWVARPAYPLAQVVVYLHWIKEKPWRLKLIQWLLNRMPELRILTTTEHLYGLLQAVGIERVAHQPYPLTASLDGPETKLDAQKFRHLLYAGAAREDKGFPLVVDLLEALAQQGRLPPAVIQVNGEKSVDPGPDMSESVARLRALAATHPQIDIIEEALSSAEYQSLFQGAIVLQLYDPVAFRNRVSGVTLDALAAGAIPLACQGTWSAALLENQGAGAVLEDRQPTESALALIERLRHEFAAESARSRSAHVRLAQQKNWGVLFETLQARTRVVNRFDARPPRRILVIQMRRIGDVLLTTPVLESLRHAFPKATISMLVFAETANVLKGVSSVDEVMSISSRPSAVEQLHLLTKIFQSFDIALCPSTSDRPLIFARLAARRSFAFHRKGWGWMFTATAPFDDLHTHTVSQNLRLIQLMGIEPKALVRAPWEPLSTKHRPAKPYVVIHPFPKFEYKKWQVEHWQVLIDAITRAGLEVIISGGHESDEIRHNQRLAGAVDLSGCLSLAELSSLVSEARAYVGPDTATTHMAASLGTPTVALFGPSNPVKWGPWPAGDAADALAFDQSPWCMRGSQHVGNVILLQGPGDCVPCRLEGCDRHVGSKSKCLDMLEPNSVLQALRNLNVLA
jgi:heptosyltransferase III